jgi:glyceraldehyde-3-phosphate dehydrogenase/erythrose-4-phosphate dehydrogenase
MTAGPTGNYLSGVTLGGTMNAPVVTLAYNAIGNGVAVGQTVVYTGSCTTSGLTWTVSGTVQSKYFPKS